MFNQDSFFLTMADVIASTYAKWWWWWSKWGYVSELHIRITCICKREITIAY
jgi:hypothetical protein